MNRRSLLSLLLTLGAVPMPKVSCGKAKPSGSLKFANYPPFIEEPQTPVIEYTDLEDVPRKGWLTIYGDHLPPIADYGKRAKVFVGGAEVGLYRSVTDYRCEAVYKSPNWKNNQGLLVQLGEYPDSQMGSYHQVMLVVDGIESNVLKVRVIDAPIIYFQNHGFYIDAEK